MRGQRALWAKGDDHLWLDLADAPREVAGNLVQTLLIQTAVWIVEHVAAGGVQMLACGGKFLAADRGQLFVVPGGSPVARGLSGVRQMM